MQVEILAPDGKPWGAYRRHAMKPRPWMIIDERGNGLLQLKPVPRAVRIFLNPFSKNFY